MAQPVVITHSTIVDRGYHDSESVSIRGAGHDLALGIGYAGPDEGYNYRAILRSGSERHVLRYIKGRRAEPILTQEVGRLSSAFEAAGWHAQKNTNQESVGFGVFQTKTVITLSPQDNAAAAPTIIAAYISAITGTAAHHLAAEQAAQQRQRAQATTCTVIQEVIWGHNQNDWRFISERISRILDDGDDKIALYRLGPMLQRGDRWGAYFSRHNGSEDEIITSDYPLASKGGNRPNRSDPPAIHLDTQVNEVVAELEAQGWHLVEQTQEGRATHDSEYFTITRRFAR